MTASRESLLGRPRWLDLLGDGLKAAGAQPVMTATTMLVVAIVCCVVLLTAGRSAATEQAVMGSIDDVGTRILTITDAGGEGRIAASAVSEIAGLHGVTWAFGLAQATDVQNADLTQRATGVTSRVYVGDLPAELVIEAGRLPTSPGEVIVGVEAVSQLSMATASGALTDRSVRTAAVGQFRAVGALESLNTIVLERGDPAALESPRYIYVLAESAEQVPDLVEALLAMLPASRPELVDISVSEGIIALRQVVAGQLGAGSRALMAGVLGVGMILIMVTVLGATMSRRRDIGRRRALGASRSATVFLLLVQSAVPGVIGALVGTGVGLFAVRSISGSLPAPEFTLGLVVLALLMTVVGSIPPAVAAAFRDPVRILRVP